MDPIYDFYCLQKGSPKIGHVDGIDCGYPYSLQYYPGRFAHILGYYGMVRIRIDINVDPVIMIAWCHDNNNLANIKLSKLHYTPTQMDRVVQTFCTKVGTHARMLKKSTGEMT